MEKETLGAWLLAQSKTLDRVQGAARLEKITYAGKIGRLYNLLRRGTLNEPTPVIDAQTVSHLTQLNDIDLATRKEGLRLLKEAGRIDLGKDGSVAILGATSRIVLETTSDIFEYSEPSKEEVGILELAEQVSKSPIDRAAAEEFIGDLCKIPTKDAKYLVDLSKETALLDEESDRGRCILFNGNVFRDKERAKKAYFILDSLNDRQRASLTEVEELLRKRGALQEDEVGKILGTDLYKRLTSIGYFDRMEVNNLSEAVGYLALPDAFQKFGRPFEEDPVDDAKALLASLTYGMTRSSAIRGQIVLPEALLRKMIAGLPVGPVQAIGEDYRELERRGVVKVTPTSYSRFRMTLLKRDVGELALAIIKGRNAAHETVLLDGSIATGFKGPEQNRRRIRKRQNVDDRRFVTDALDRIRSGG